jgi:hypothetical protein
MQTHFKADTAFGQDFTADLLMSDSSIKRAKRREHFKPGAGFGDLAFSGG